MKSQTMWKKRIRTRLSAIVMAVALSMSSISGMAPGGVAYAENSVAEEVIEDVTLEKEPEEVTDDATLEKEPEEEGAEDESAIDEASESDSASETEKDVTDLESTGNGEAYAEAIDETAEATASEKDNAVDSIDEVATDEINIKAIENNLGEVDKDKVNTEAEQSASAIVTVSGRSFDSNNDDVWDFDASSDYSPYTNLRLDADTINSFYPGVKSGAIGEYLPSFVLDDGDFEFHDGGNRAKLYSKNTAVTRYKTGIVTRGDYVKDFYTWADGVITTRGGILCDKVTDEDPYIVINCQKGDSLRVMSVKNSSLKIVKMFEPDTPVDLFWGYKVPESGKYKIFSGNDFFGVGCIYRRHEAALPVLFGKLYGSEGIEPFKLMVNGVEAKVTNGTYAVRLSPYPREYGASYLISGLEGYRISEESARGLSECYNSYDGWLFDDGRDVKWNIDFEMIRVNVSGNISGIPENHRENSHIGVLFESTNNVSGAKIKKWADEGWSEYYIDGIPYGEYDVMVKNSKTGTVFARYKTKFTEDSKFDLDAAFGDYETRDDEVNIVCDVYGLHPSYLADTTFWFTYNDSDKSFRTGDYECNELLDGLARIPKGCSCVLHASGLPDGYYLNSAPFTITDANCTNGKYFYTIKLSNEPTENKKTYKVWGNISGDIDFDQFYMYFCPYEHDGSAIDVHDDEKVEVEAKIIDGKYFLEFDRPHDYLYVGNSTECTFFKTNPSDYYDDTGWYFLRFSEENYKWADFYLVNPNNHLFDFHVMGVSLEEVLPIVFTDKENGKQIRATIDGACFSVPLKYGGKYEIEVEDNNYCVPYPNFVLSPFNTYSFDLSNIENIKIAEAVYIKGKVLGITDDIKSFANEAKIKFTPTGGNSEYVPKVTISEDGTFETKIQKGIEYKISVEGLDESKYKLLTKEIVFNDDTTDVFIEFDRLLWNIKDFGAEGDGVTDDTEAIRKALIAANGQKLYVPAGKYCVSSIDISDISVDMYSDGDAVFYKMDAGVKPIFQFNNCNSGKIMEITFDAGSERLGGGTNTSCIGFNNASNIEISNCEFKDTASETLVFYGNCENINVNNNKYNNANGVAVFGRGTVKHAVIENNVAHGGSGNGVVILEQGKTSESFDIAVRNNEFHNYTGGSIVQLRNVSDVRIENNYADGGKYFLMSPKPSSKTFTEPHVSDVRVQGNSGSVTNYVRLYTYAENPNALYKNISFSNNDFTATSGLEAYACDGISFNNDKLSISGSASLKFFDSQNIELNGLTVDTKKSSKPIIKLDACDYVKLVDINNTVDRVLLQITNSDNARLIFENVKADFSKLDNNIIYSDGLRVESANCTNYGKEFSAYMSGKTLMLPITGNDFTLEGSEDIHIVTVRGNFEKGKKITLHSNTGDIYFDKGGNVLVSNSVRYPKESDIELEYNGKKWTLKNTPFIITNSEDVTAAVGEKVKFTVKVSGGSGQYAYRWFVSPDDGKTWNKSSYSGSKKDTVSFVVSEKTYTFKFKCRVTDSATGEEYYSNIMVVNAPEPEGFIKTQPKDYQVKAGENAIYTVEVNGKAKSYQWYKSKGEGKPWQKLFCTGARTNKLEIPVEKYMNNYLIYCVIKDADGNEYSTDTAKIILIK